MRKKNQPSGEPPKPGRAKAFGQSLAKAVKDERASRRDNGRLSRVLRFPGDGAH